MKGCWIYNVMYQYFTTLAKFSASPSGLKSCFCHRSPPGTQLHSQATFPSCSTSDLFPFNFSFLWCECIYFPQMWSLTLSPAVSNTPLHPPIKCTVRVFSGGGGIFYFKIIIQFVKMDSKSLLKAFLPLCL